MRCLMTDNLEVIEELQDLTDLAKQTAKLEDSLISERRKNENLKIKTSNTAFSRTI